MLVVGLLVGCARKPAIDAVSVSRFENLSGDPSLDWTASAVPAILAAELPRAAAGSRYVLEGYLARAGGRLRLSAFLIDTRSNKIADNFIAASSGILPVAGALARHLDPAARPYSTGNEEALKAYTQGDFERAVARDADFGAAYVQWSESLASRGDAAGADRVIALARQRGDRIPGPDRIRLDLIAATLHGDMDAQIRAMIALASFAPADARLRAQIGDFEVRKHQYAAAVVWYKQAAALEPGEAQRLNQLGYAQCWTHDLDGARQTLVKYQEMLPQDANPLDSLGDVHYYWGHFADAEKYYLQAHDKDAAFLGGGTLLKAAHARLMTGDIAGAGAIFGQYAAFRRSVNDPLVAYRQAQWDFLCGRRKKAMESLRQLGTSPALSQLAVWLLQTGDRDGAREAAGRAAAIADTPGAARQAALSVSLLSPKAAEERFPGPQGALLRKLALGYGLLFNQEFAAAAPIFQELFGQASPSDPAPLGVMLAWTLIETGRVKDATDPLTPNPLPNAGGDDLLESVAFPRIFQLRSIVLGERRRMTESLGFNQLFLKLSGDVPQIWDARKPAARAPHRL
jgi:Flp pilus assembly protein TadD